jgi:hypothetical protein
MCRYMLTLSFLMLAASAAAGDTIYLKNGVYFDGTVTKRPDGLYSVQAGKRSMLYREHEIKRIEKNSRTGAFNREEAMDRWQERDKELTRITGLNAEQRRQVKKLMFQLSGDTAERKRIRGQLIELQKDMDVFRYLEWQQMQLSHRLSPWVLEAMFYLDAARARGHLRENLDHGYEGNRIVAMELLGRMRDRESAPAIARGLVDIARDVRVAAARSLGIMGAKEATPALIETLKASDLRVSAAAREGLNAIWQKERGENVLKTVVEWNAIWEEHGAGITNAIYAESLDPLVAPEDQYIAG